MAGIYSIHSSLFSRKVAKIYHIFQILNFLQSCGFISKVFAYLEFPSKLRRLVSCQLSIEFLDYFTKMEKIHIKIVQNKRKKQLTISLLVTLYILNIQLILDCIWWEKSQRYIISIKNKNHGLDSCSSSIEREISAANPAVSLFMSNALPKPTIIVCSQRREK